ncbi:hypothetical protein OSC27_05300 [Microbacterium sp. STN6]|uniref:PH-like domain-containing protein n=1 Tax=Microbacterium sp. STN6 TaxID=2995588 RepID=UPI002260C3FB|nr:hypothetical protein [Microbacterium sp. STN6]MCX7521694.1 hypothetical protein [Microbacterium sp. STN6]
MDKLLPTIVIAIVFVGIITLMVLSWRRRVRRDAALRPEPVAEAARGALLEDADVLYVATTAHEEPLERLAVAGLGFRGRAHLAVHEGGVSLRVTGEQEVFVRADAIVECDAASWTIDRAVEKDGLIVIGWRIPRGDDDVSVDTYLRVVDLDARARLIEAIASISGATSAGTQEK